MTTPAFADIPPADACDASDAGKACDNAGDDADQPGICQPDTCRRATPSGSMSYDCYLCKPQQGGSGGASAAGGAPAAGGTQPSAGSAGRSGESPKDDGGCALSSAPAGRSTGALTTLAGLALASFCRRRPARARS